MAFERKFKEVARAHDAVDRLRELQERLVERDAEEERRRDLVFRGVILAVLAVIVAIAIVKL